VIPAARKLWVADRRHDAGGKSALAHHPPGVGLNHRLLGECEAQVSAAGAEEEALLEVIASVVR